MPGLEESIAAIREGANEDRFTYLTILQYHVTTPGVLPTLNEVLQNGELTQEIGWDLVQMLLDIEDSGDCLETVARLGNPREVIIKVMEALEGLTVAWHDEVVIEVDRPGVLPDSKIPGKFITLLGMLAILHRRIQTRYPSRFLGSALVKVFEAYQPTMEMTAAVVNLVRSLSGQKRPPLPTRSSSIDVANPDQDGDASKNAPDPEAEQEDPKEEVLQQKLLQSFVTCILQQYVNAQAMLWSPRLLEVYHPEKLVPGRKTATESFREDKALQKRDAMVGQLVALSRDLGLNSCPKSFIKNIYAGSRTNIDPLGAFEDCSSPNDIHLSPGGVVCLIAYWIFSTEVFGSDNPHPDMHIFPEHLALLERFLGTEAQVEISSSPGIADALLAIGLGLEHREQTVASEGRAFMAYHHHLTLISVFHPDIQVRNAATTFAGTILHSDPDDQNRLEILEDLLENCMFASLKACAVTWLKEELTTARKEKLSNLFSKPDVIERLQYAAFPDMISVAALDNEALVDFWAQNHTFLLQVANFAFFLFTGFKELVPEGMAAAVEHRFSEPLILAAEKLESAAGVDDEGKMHLDILTDRLRSINLH
ncbi:YAP-binding/ALF4/Glomulin [Biscogniauxia marginata]|nr:YAP-binding/ALF4/Glomulin [Biscogniauxia marginata]